MKKIFLVGFLVLVLIVAGCSQPQKTPNPNNGDKITVYKSPSCGCCGGYVADLGKNGFDVEVIETANMASVKEKYNIPRSMESCHTSIIGDYFIEGHVPIEAVNKLLEEQPDIDGIALPRMTAGSPGMPGTKQEPWKIYALTDGKTSEFMTI
jgi:hypothetical protein